MKALRLLEIVRDYDYPHINEAVEIKTLYNWKPLNLSEVQVKTLQWFLCLGVDNFEIPDLREAQEPGVQIVEIKGRKYELREIK